MIATYEFPYTETRKSQFGEIQFFLKNWDIALAQNTFTVNLMNSSNYTFNINILGMMKALSSFTFMRLEFWNTMNGGDPTSDTIIYAVII